MHDACIHTSGRHRSSRRNSNFQPIILSSSHLLAPHSIVRARSIAPLHAAILLQAVGRPLLEQHHHNNHTSNSPSRSIKPPTYLSNNNSASPIYKDPNPTQWPTNLPPPRTPPSQPPPTWSLIPPPPTATRPTPPTKTRSPPCRRNPPRPPSSAPSPTITPTPRRSGARVSSNWSCCCRW